MLSTKMLLNLLIVVTFSTIASAFDCKLKCSIKKLKNSLNTK